MGFIERCGTKKTRVTKHHHCHEPSYLSMYKLGGMSRPPAVSVFVRGKAQQLRQGVNKVLWARGLAWWESVKCGQITGAQPF